MFHKVISEKAGFRWLTKEIGDAELLFADPPEPWERALLWIVRVDNRAEMRRAMLHAKALIGRGKVKGIAWFAGHDRTREFSKFASYACGSKFISLDGDLPGFFTRDLRRTCDGERSATGPAPQLPAPRVDEI